MRVNIPLNFPAGVAGGKEICYNSFNYRLDVFRRVRDETFHSGD